MARPRKEIDQKQFETSAACNARLRKSAVFLCMYRYARRDVEL